MCNYTSKRKYNVIRHQNSKHINNITNEENNILKKENNILEKEKNILSEEKNISDNKNEFFY